MPPERTYSAPSAASGDNAADLPGSNARYIDNARSLTEFTAELRDALASDARLAFDTEFIRERTYAPVLEVVQVAASGGALIGIVDVPAVRGDLGDLGDLLLDETIVKIVHAGGQDMEILTSLLGRAPGPVFDTQIAAAFTGYGLQTGYGALVQTLLNVRLNKEEGFADWSRRPLTASMLDYAENDVRHLAPLHDRLTSLLAKRGRNAWADEQMRRTLAHSAEETAPEDLWRKVGGKNLLDGRGLAILRELALWRDEEARRRDKPRRSVIKDDALVEIAKRAPQTASVILGLRGMPPNLGERTATQLAERVARGLAVPDADRPFVESIPPLDEQASALLDLFGALVRLRASDESLPPSLLASGDDLRALAASARKNNGLPPDLASGALFNGWRADLIGNDLAAVVRGETAFAWDPKKRRVALERLQKD